MYEATDFSDENKKRPKYVLIRCQVNFKEKENEDAKEEKLPLPWDQIRCDDDGDDDKGVYNDENGVYDDDDDENGVCDDDDDDDDEDDDVGGPGFIQK